MPRAHLYRPLQDSAGNIQRGATVRVLLPNSDTLVPFEIYADDEGLDTLNNPVTCPTGQLSLYFETPRRVRLAVSPFGGGAETFFENIDALAEGSSAFGISVSPIPEAPGFNVQAVLESLNGNDGALSARLDNSSTDISEHETRLDGHDTQFTQAFTEIGQVDAKADLTNLEVEAAKVTLQDHGTRLDGHDSDVLAIDGRLDTLESTDLAYDGRLDVLEARETVAAHEAETDPHPQYLTADELPTPPEGNPFQSTSAPGLPLATNRTHGDLHYDETARIEYVVTGYPATLTQGTKVVVVQPGSLEGNLFDVGFTLTLSDYVQQQPSGQWQVKGVVSDIVNPRGVSMPGGQDLIFKAYGADGVSLGDGIIFYRNASISPQTLYFSVANGTANGSRWQFEIRYGASFGAERQDGPGSNIPESRAWTSTDQFVASHTHSQVQPFRVVMTSTTLSATDGIVQFSGTDLTGTLPTPVGRAGTQFTIKNVDISNLTVATAAGTIDADTTRVLAQYDSLTVVSDGTNWSVV